LVNVLIERVLSSSNAKSRGRSDQWTEKIVSGAGGIAFGRTAVNKALLGGAPRTAFLVHRLIPFTDPAYCSKNHRRSALGSQGPKYSEDARLLSKKLLDGKPNRVFFSRIFAAKDHKNEPRRRPKFDHKILLSFSSGGHL